MKKTLLGCSAFLVLVAVGLAVLLALNWDKSDIDSSDIATDSLSRDLEEEFGGQPDVEFICVLPIVGPAPCILDNDEVTRQVTLTFTNYKLPLGISLEEQARRIAVISFNRSDFVKESDEMNVIFDNTERGEFATTSRTSKYSFDSDALAAVVASDALTHEAGNDE